MVFFVNCVRNNQFINSVIFWVKMKQIVLIISLFLTGMAGVKALSIFVEAESFASKGGWVVDPEFVEQMGSPYLLAHGMGKPVKDARTNITVKKAGMYHVWLRTKNWAPGNWEAPGRFYVLVDGKRLERTLGNNPEWNWEYAGSIVSAWSADHAYPRPVVGRNTFTLFNYDPNHTTQKSFGRTFESPVQIWSSCYTGIERANWVIEKVPAINMDATRRDVIVREAFFLRAFYHWSLTKNFSDVVIKIKVSTDLDNAVVGKSAKADVYKQIFAGLDQAVSKLPSYSTNIQKGRPSKEVRFSFGMPYTETNLMIFLKSYTTNENFEIGTLAGTRDGRSVERLHLGNLHGTPKYRVLLTTRHHACEMKANYLLEGIIEEVLGKSERAEWFRKNVEFLIIPFVNKDGVENGDQGKNCRGRDHNRDYSNDSIFATTKVLRALVSVWSGGKLAVAIDLYCHSIRGKAHEEIHLVGHPSEQISQEQNRFSGFLEKASKQESYLPYYASSNLPFGISWNTASNTGKGESFAGWADEIKELS